MATTEAGGNTQTVENSTAADVTVPVILLGTGDDDILSFYARRIPVYQHGGDYLGAVITGYGGNDKLYGSHGGDAISGNAGNDLLVGYYGDDSLNGGEDSDTVDYSYYGYHALQPYSSKGVYVDLGNGYADGRRDGLNEHDTLTSIENVVGSRFNDVILGSDADNALDGSYGDDFIFGFKGNDLLTGGFGADKMSGGEGNDMLNGGLGNDHMAGNEGLDYVNYKYAAGPVTVLLWQGTADAGAGDQDTLVEIEGVIGTASGDHIEGDSAANLLLGEKGGDWLVGLGGDDRLYGDEGDDILAGGAGADELNGSFGNDTAEYIGSAEGVSASLFAGIGGKHGDAEGDTYSDIENIKGSQFGDELSGNDGENTLMGLGGKDFIVGGGGEDRLYGDDGEDTLNGGSGYDWLSGGGGADFVDGGDGEDTLTFNDDTSSAVTVNLTTGKGSGGDAEGDSYVNVESALGTSFADRLTGNDGSNALLGGLGNDSLDGRGGADMMDGGEDNDAMQGGAGDDVLWGNGGRDKVSGGAGADYVSGNQGGDTLSGNAGADVFVYYEPADSKATGTGRDLIVDFMQGSDVIDLERIDAVIGLEQQNQAFGFIGQTAFGNHAGELRYTHTGGNTLVEADVNGNGVADFAILLTGTLDLVAEDFVL